MLVLRTVSGKRVNVLEDVDSSICGSLGNLKAAVVAPKTMFVDKTQIYD